MAEVAWLTGEMVEAAAAWLAARSDVPAAEFAALIRRDVAAMGPPGPGRTAIVREVDFTGGGVLWVRFGPGLVAGMAPWDHPRRIWPAVQPAGSSSIAASKGGSKPTPT